MRPSSTVSSRSAGVVSRLAASCSAFAASIDRSRLSLITWARWARPITSRIRATLPSPRMVAPAKDDRPFRWLTRGLSRPEEHTSELQSLMRISYAVCCLKKKTQDDVDRHYMRYCIDTIVQLQY